MDTKKLATFVGIFVIAVLGFVLYRNSGSSDLSSKKTTSSSREVSKEEVKSATSQQDTSKIDSEFAKRFVAYSDNALKAATEKGRAVVFFHAAWCESCKQAKADLKANFDKVPSDVTILDVDYDTASELKAKYAITMQDTWVQVNSEGGEITKWNSGGEGLNTLLANLR